jgi:ubiquinone/menaquinone biosynthesis C-methylase UbiE
MSYSAKTDYQSADTARGYETRSMYAGFVGRRRVRIETSVINGLVSEMEPDSVILDCPCGNGRWFSSLSKRARSIIATDISTGMTDYARTRAPQISCPVDVRIEDAENLSLPDQSVDYVFSYALMKHLPVNVQYRVLSEFSRVARKGVVCSFALLKPVSYAYWRYKKPVESYPVIAEELEAMAKQAGLKLRRTVKVSQPVVGLEYFAAFDRTAV